MKKIIILSSGLLLVVVVMIVGAKQIKNGSQESPYGAKNEQIKNNVTIKERIPYQARADQEHITNREAAIRDFNDFFGDPLFKKTVIQGRTFFMVGYDNGHHPDTGFPTGGGIIIFEKTTNGKFNLFWESREDIVHAEGGYSRFQDLTNDGIPEIVVQDSASATGQNTSYYVYAWRNNTFQLVTPLQVVTPLEPWGRTNATKIGGDNAETYIKDIDNDKIMEIIDGYISDTDHMLHQEIYKWNGKEYYLWKKVVEKKKYE